MFELGTLFSCESVIDRQIIVNQTSVFGRHFIKNEQTEPVTSRRKNDIR